MKLFVNSIISINTPLHGQIQLTTWGFSNLLTKILNAEIWLKYCVWWLSALLACKLQIFWELVIHFAVQWWEQMELKRFKPCLVIQLLCWFPRSCTEAFMREKYTSAIIWWPAATQNFPTKMAAMVMSYNQSNVIKNHSYGEEEQLLSTGALLLFGFCCIGPVILLAVLGSAICCKQPWKALCIHFPSLCPCPFAQSQYTILLSAVTGL